MMEFHTNLLLMILLEKPINEYEHKDKLFLVPVVVWSSTVKANISKVKKLNDHIQRELRQ